MFFIHQLPVFALFAPRLWNTMEYTIDRRSLVADRYMLLQVTNATHVAIASRRMAVSINY